MHKIVNGQQVELSKQEEEEMLQAWKAADDYQLKYGYIEKRQFAYAKIADQLDMLWHAMDSGEIPKSKAFYDAINTIKQKYPKPRK